MSKEKKLPSGTKSLLVLIVWINFKSKSTNVQKYKFQMISKEPKNPGKWRRAEIKSAPLESVFFF